jgi:cytoskeletal protein CcmA (bactofilin family)
MTTEITVALLAFLGTCVGTLGGILAANKLTVYRISQLEKKVEKHNSVVERTFKLEGEVRELQHEVRDLRS